MFAALIIYRLCFSGFTGCKFNLELDLRTRSILKAISTSVQASQPRCPFGLWRRLIDHGISRAKQTRRGHPGGIRKCKALHQLQNLQAEFPRGSRDHFCMK